MELEHQRLEMLERQEEGRARSAARWMQHTGSFDATEADCQNCSVMVPCSKHLAPKHREIVVGSRAWRDLKRTIYIDRRSDATKVWACFGAIPGAFVEMVCVGATCFTYIDPHGSQRLLSWHSSRSDAELCLACPCLFANYLLQAADADKGAQVLKTLVDKADPKALANFG